MPLRVLCPGCGTSCSIPDILCGKNVRCPQCKHVFPTAARPEVATPPQADPVIPTEAPPKLQEALQSTQKRVPVIPPVSQPRSRPLGEEDRPDGGRKPLAKKSSSGLPLLLMGCGLATGLLLLLLVGGGIAWYKFAPRSVPDGDAVQNPDGGEKVPADREPVAAEFNLTEARKSVVFIKLVSPGFGTSVGTGFLVHKDGLIWTNRHVVELPNPNVKGALLLVGVPSRKDPDTLDYFNAEVAYQSEANAPLDFAVLKIAARPDYGDFPALPTSFEKVELASIVAALGFPHIKGDQPVFSFNRGGISATRVVFEGKTYYQTDAAVNPGNSGGPLVDIKGRAIGIVTFKKHNANNMGYAVYLSEVQEAARRAEELVARVRPTAGPLDPKSLPTLTTVPPKANNWAVVQGRIEEKQAHLSIDNDGGVYWMATRDPLPENFQAVIPCQIEFLKGRQVIQPTQEAVLRTLCIRFGVAETANDIMDRTGYTLNWSHRRAILYRNRQSVLTEPKGNPDERFLLTITKQGGEILVTVNGEVVIHHRDAQPLLGKHCLQIGGYLSRLAVGEVSITKLDEGAGPGPVVGQKGSVETVVTSTKITKNRADITIEARLKNAPQQLRWVTVYYAREEAGQNIQPDGAGNWRQIPNAQSQPMDRQADRATGSIRVHVGGDERVATYLIQAAYTTMDGTIVFAPPVRHTVDFAQGAVVKPLPNEFMEAEVRQLPCAAADVCVGGGGRFLILHLQKQGQLAVFDTHETNIVRTVPAPEDQIRFAAGKDKLIVVLPGAGQLQRWSLASGERELAVPLPVKSSCDNVLLGSASDGPLCLDGTFIDIQTMKVLEMKGERVVIREGSFARISADGTVITTWKPNTHPQGIRIFVRLGNEVKQYYEHSSAEHLIPGADGKVIYSGRGRFTTQAKPIDKAFSDGPGTLPSVHGNYYMLLEGPSGRPYLMIYLAGHVRPFAALRPQPLSNRLHMFDGMPFGIDKRVLLIPAAKLIVTIPESNDRLLLHRFDVEEALERSGLDYLVVTSQPADSATRGQPYTYQLTAKSKKGGLKYKVDAGPREMAISDSGKVTWNVPQDAADEQDIILNISDASGQEVFQSFRLRVTGGVFKPDDKPPELAPEKVEKPLPSTVGEVCVGGGGRFLILHLPKLRQLAIFDVNEAKVVKYIPLADGEIKYAASMDKLVVVLPVTNVIQRWSLTTFEREVVAPVPVKGTVNGVAMGSASNGPLYISYPADGGPGHSIACVFLDIETLKPLPMKGPDGQMWFGFVPGSPPLRMSADGSVLCTPNQGILSYVRWGNEWRQFHEGHFPGGYVCSGPDGRVLFTARGLYTNEAKPLPGNHRPGEICVPAHHGNYFLAVGQDTKAGWSVCMLGDERPFAKLPNVEVPEGINQLDRKEFGKDQRIHFLPDAKLIVVIPASNDRLVLYRFDVKEALDKSGINYLVVTSRPPLTAKRGEGYSYPLVVESKKGGLKYKVEAGPPGMAISESGKLTWSAPGDSADDQDIVLIISDASGQEVFHNFKLRVTGEAVVKPDGKPKDPPKPADKPKAPPRDPADIKPPAFQGDRAERLLPSTVTDMCVGGGGRFLILHLPQRRHLAIFDISEAKVVKYIPLAEGEVKFAAGMDSLLVLLSEANLLERWSLTTFEREASSPLPERGKVTALAMGSASNGPLFVGVVEAASFFVDPATMKKIDIKATKGLGSEVFVRASADGKVFGLLYRTGGEPHTCATYVFLDNKSVAVHQVWDFRGCVVVPGPDGRFTYAASAVYTSELKVVHPKPPPQDNIKGFLPALMGGYYMRLEPRHHGQPGGELVFFLQGSDREFARLDGIEGVTQEQIGYGKNRDTLTPDQRVFFNPAAKVVISIPGTNDRLIVRRFDIDEAVEKSGIDYLFATSQPPLVAEKGKEYTYQLTIKSKKGGVKYKLESGPVGMKVAADGKVTWPVPADAADEQDVILTVSNSSGQEIIQTWKLRIHDAAVKPDDKPKDPPKP